MKGTMKKKLLRRGLFMTGAAVMIMTTPAFAMVKSVELRIDTDSITDHDAAPFFRLLRSRMRMKA